MVKSVILLSAAPALQSDVHLCRFTAAFGGRRISSSKTSFKKQKQCHAIAENAKFRQFCNQVSDRIERTQTPGLTFHSVLPPPIHKSL